jgi:hypothetical protein
MPVIRPFDRLFIDRASQVDPKNKIEPRHTRHRGGCNCITQKLFFHFPNFSFALPTPTTQTNRNTMARTKAQVMREMREKRKLSKIGKKTAKKRPQRSLPSATQMMRMKWCYHESGGTELFRLCANPSVAAFVDEVRAVAIYRRFMCYQNIADDDTDVAMAAIALDKSAFEHMSENLRGNIDVATAAIYRYPAMLAKVNLDTIDIPELKSVIIEFIDSGIDVIDWCHPRFYNDLDVAKAYVRQRPDNIRRTSARLQADRSSIKDLLDVDPMILRFLSSGQCADPDIMQHAVGVDPNTVVFSECDRKSTKAIWETIRAKHPEFAKQVGFE